MLLCIAGFPGGELVKVLSRFTDALRQSIGDTQHIVELSALFVKPYYHWFSSSPLCQHGPSTPGPIMAVILKISHVQICLSACFSVCPQCQRPGEGAINNGLPGSIKH